jgi:hypothetical protein
MKGKQKRSSIMKRDAYQSGDFVFQNALPLANEKFCLITWPLDTLEFFWPMLYMLKEACIG